LKKCRGSRLPIGGFWQRWKRLRMAGQPSAGHAIGADRWDADCEIAFEQALPPAWECRDRAFSSSSMWRELDSHACGQINAMAARGQRQGNIMIKGRDGSMNEFEVSLQDPHNMWAKPTDQYSAPRCERKLRKVPRQPKTNKTALKHFYAQYMRELSPADHPGGPDGIDEDNIGRFFGDLGIDPGSDVVALAFAAACKASEMGVFRRREFICGCAALGVDSLDELQAKVPELRASYLSGVIRYEVYAYTFGIAVEAPSKVLPLEAAKLYWEVLLPNWELRADFCDWAEKHMKGKMISRDLWMMVLKLATEVPADLSTYDENPAWPVVFDEFVEYYRANRGA